MSDAVESDPILRFQRAFERAQQSEPFEASRAALATTESDGQPAVRFVLVKRADARGFAFYTNLQSPKALALKTNPRAELCFHWFTIGEQVRVRGVVQPVADEEADAYFASRPRGSQLGAWASRQSEPVASREALDAQVEAIAGRFADGEVPRPAFWSGLCVVPSRMEFWQNRDDRLHDRFRYEREGDAWRCERLQP